MGKVAKKTTEISKQEFVLPKLTCLRCKYKWIPRSPNPRLCPSCHNPYNTERKYKAIGVKNKGDSNDNKK